MSGNTVGHTLMPFAAVTSERSCEGNDVFIECGIGNRHPYATGPNVSLAGRMSFSRPCDVIISAAVSDKFDATVSFHACELDELSFVSA